jgi:hypothetical protein
MTESCDREPAAGIFFDGTPLPMIAGIAICAVITFVIENLSLPIPPAPPNGCVLMVFANILQRHSPHGNRTSRVHRRQEELMRSKGKHP